MKLNFYFSAKINMVFVHLPAQTQARKHQIYKYTAQNVIISHKKEVNNREAVL